MKKIIMVAAALMAAVTAGAQVAGGEAKYEDFIQVTGKAERDVTPDEIYVRIVIDETQLKQRQTVEQLEQDMIASLKRLGVDTDKDLKIDDMSSGYKSYFLRGNTARTSATYQLKVGSAAMLGLVYQSMESLGISNLDVVRVSHSRLREIQGELRVEAMRDAQAIASSLAGAVGQRAGRAVWVADYNNDMGGVMPMVRSAMTMSNVAGAGYATDLDFNQMRLSYSVNAKFALE